ncbi:hypothetical protein QTP70_002577 [Hemibagrus guttatus]|uniref:Integrase catalytic domain-containing protein n=1 Tax=Hemibagrus guttatus TaxID=175788 RepID=A0AAE0R6S1_9TELE|nr:hypothetical protein QTP70_002577 [Hemibagrus guttatus]
MVRQMLCHGNSSLPRSLYGSSLSSSYHPSKNGQAERLNQEIGRFLRSHCSREQHWWTELREIIVRQGAIIRSYQDQLADMQAQLSRNGDRFSSRSAAYARALEWASAVWDADPQIKASYDYFSRDD